MNSVPRFIQSEEHGPLFKGWEPRECGEHREVGDYRAWCYDCTEWCYSRTIDMACKGCEITHLRNALMERTMKSTNKEAQNG